MKECPNCGKIYRDFDQYCLVCNYKLKYVEGSEKVEYCPDSTGTWAKSQGETPTVTCPYCQSTDTKKISKTSKAVHTALFGIFSMGRNAKQWHCNNCNSDF